MKINTTLWKEIQRGLKDKPDLDKIFSKHISDRGLKSKYTKNSQNSVITK